MASTTRLDPLYQIASQKIKRPLTSVGSIVKIKRHWFYITLLIDLSFIK